MHSSSLRVEHEVSDGILTVHANCEAIQDGRSQISIVSTTLRFLAEAARVIVQERAVFDLAKPSRDTIVDLGMTVKARTIDQPPTIYAHRVVRDPIQYGQ